MKLKQNPVPLNSIEREYLRYLNTYANTYTKLLREGLKDLMPGLKETAGDELPRVDAWRMDENIEDRIRQLMESIEKQLNIMFPNALLRRWILSMIGKTNRLNKKGIQKQVNKSYRQKYKGEEVPDFEPLMRDGKLSPYFQNIVEENIGLIRSIKEGKETLFKNKLVSLITGDAKATTISEAISKYIDETKGHPATIARDQIGKLNGQLNEYRQQQLGGKKYIWHNSHDSRVSGNPGGKYPKAKPSHWEREGKTYLWSKPPKGGHPGQRINCRCWAEMIVEDND